MYQKPFQYHIYLFNSQRFYFIRTSVCSGPVHFMFSVYSCYCKNLCKDWEWFSSTETCYTSTEWLTDRFLYRPTPADIQHDAHTHIKLEIIDTEYFRHKQKQQQQQQQRFQNKRENQKQHGQKGSLSSLLYWRRCGCCHTQIEIKISIAQKILYSWAKCYNKLLKVTKVCVCERQQQQQQPKKNGALVTLYLFNRQAVRNNMARLAIIR